MIHIYTYVWQLAMQRAPLASCRTPGAVLVALQSHNFGTLIGTSCSGPLKLNLLIFSVAEVCYLEHF